MTRQRTIPTIRANVLAGIVRDLRDQGEPVRRALVEHIGRSDGFDDPYEQIPLAGFVRFLEAAARALDDPVLGVKLGARSQPDSFGPVGMMFLASGNLRHALQRFNTYFAAWQGGTRVELDTRDSLPELVYQIIDPLVWPRRQDAEFSLAGTCTFIRGLLGARWSPVEVHFEHDRSAQATRETEAALQRIFRAPVHFGQTVNRLVLDPADFDHQAAPRGSAMAPFLERHLDDLLRADSPAATSCAARVSRLISQRLGREDFDVLSIAADLGLSARTLQRQLAREGTSLRDLLRTHRTQAVDRLLEGRRAKMTVIAHDMGYADAATFSRAFKRWRGASPRQHRHTNAAGGVPDDRAPTPDVRTEMTPRDLD